MRSCSSRRATSAKVLLGRSALVAFVAAFANGCGSSESEPTESEPQGSDCEGHGEPIVLGMEKPTDGGLYRVGLVEASPLPPVMGENDWTVEVATSDGEPVIDDAELVDTSVIADIEMVGHQHRLRKGGVMTTAGVFEFPPLPITMPGYWEFTISVGPEGSDDPNAIENALFGFCVPPD